LFPAGGALLVAVGVMHFLGRLAPSPDNPAFALIVSIPDQSLNTRTAFSRRNFGQTWSLNGTFGMSPKMRSRVRPAGK